MAVPRPLVVEVRKVELKPDRAVKTVAMVVVTATEGVHMGVVTIKTIRNLALTVVPLSLGNVDPLGDLPHGNWAGGGEEAHRATTTHLQQMLLLDRVLHPGNNRSLMDLLQGLRPRPLHGLGHMECPSRNYLAMHHPGLPGLPQA